ncbi:AAA family ATPase [Microbacterium paludicola]|uniref:MinD/ParA family ATP-binding protein n=1 Tax=Microbacterium paludicola TaxID=300019 RepID=UPI00119DF8E1|nr:AAA family ATPase [Microbacterium paludicola]
MTSEAGHFPRIEALTHEDGTGALIVQGRRHDVTTPDVHQTRAKLMQLAADQARALGRPVKVTTGGVEPTYHLIVDEHAHVSEDTNPPTAAATRAAARAAAAQEVITDVPATIPLVGASAPERQPEPAPQPAPAPVIEPAVTVTAVTPPRPPLPTAQATAAPASGAGAWTTEAPVTRRDARTSFLRQEQSEKPATQGLRGTLTRAGIRMAPSAAERAERADERAVSQHWPGPRTIAIVNGKGGAGKTPTTIMLSATFARYGGAGVLAWDNNQTRGTLGWRTEQGPHDGTLLDLLPQTERLLGTSAQAADLAHFVHHQTRDRFDVLRSKPVALAHEQRITPDDVDAIHSVAAKYYRLIFIDSGNDESDPMWLRMIDHADQLVIATTTRADHAEAGALLLEDLAARDARSERLARDAVAVITQADPKATRADMQHVADGYSALTRAAVMIPHDAALVDGQITYESLRPATQRAWLAAGAAVAGGLNGVQHG